jgi:hypothetical protein
LFPVTVPASAEYVPRGFVVSDAPKSLPELRFEHEAGKPLRLADFRGKSAAGA